MDNFDLWAFVSLELLWHIAHVQRLPPFLEVAEIEHSNEICDGSPLESAHCGVPQQSSHHYWISAQLNPCMIQGNSDHWLNALD